MPTTTTITTDGQLIALPLAHAHGVIIITNLIMKINVLVQVVYLLERRIVTGVVL